MRDKFTRFMMGRYGIDTLGKVNIGVVLALLIVNMFLNSPWLYWLSLILLVVAYWRMFSRNVQKRYRENQWFADRFSGIAGWFRRQKNYQAQRKEYHIYTCPSCKQKVRVPKGKGKISIHCPKCGNDFIKRS